MHDEGWGDPREGHRGHARGRVRMRGGPSRPASQAASRDSADIGPRARVRWAGPALAGLAWLLR